MKLKETYSDQVLQIGQYLFKSSVNSLFVDVLGFEQFNKQAVTLKYHTLRNYQCLPTHWVCP